MLSSQLSCCCHHGVNIVTRPYRTRTRTRPHGPSPSRRHYRHSGIRNLRDWVPWRAQEGPRSQVDLEIEADRVQTRRQSHQHCEPSGNNALVNLVLSEPSANNSSTALVSTGLSREVIDRTTDSAATRGASTPADPRR